MRRISRQTVLACTPIALAMSAREKPWSSISAIVSRWSSVRSVSYTHLDVYKRQGFSFPSDRGGLLRRISRQTVLACTPIALAMSAREKPWSSISAIVSRWSSVRSVSYTHLDVYKRQGFSFPSDRGGLLRRISRQTVLACTPIALAMSAREKPWSSISAIVSRWSSVRSVSYTHLDVYKRQGFSFPSDRGGLLRRISRQTVLACTPIALAMSAREKPWSSISAIVSRWSSVRSVSYTHLDVYKRQGFSFPSDRGGLLRRISRQTVLACTPIALAMSAREKPWSSISAIVSRWSSVRSVSYTHLDVYKRQGFSFPSDRGGLLRRISRQTVLACTPIALAMSAREKPWSSISAIVSRWSSVRSVSYTHLDVYKRQGFSFPSDRGGLLRRISRQTVLACTPIALAMSAREKPWSSISAIVSRWSSVR